MSFLKKINGKKNRRRIKDICQNFKAGTAPSGRANTLIKMNERPVEASDC